MSFRRDRETELAWQKWMRAHEGELIAIGIPREVWADRLTWGRFIEHGYHSPTENARESSFRVGDLPDEQQYRLYRFLDALLPGKRYGYSLWSILQSRFGMPAETDQ